jgi:hypothetical protein
VQSGGYTVYEGSKESPEVRLRCPPDFSTMPVHFTVATHDANMVEKTYVPPLKTPDDLLHNTWGVKAKTTKSAELLQSSLAKRDFSTILPERNGFVDTVMAAYNGHHHLVIRFVVNQPERGRLIRRYRQTGRCLDRHSRTI